MQIQSLGVYLINLRYLCDLQSIFWIVWLLNQCVMEFTTYKPLQVSI